MFVLLLNHTRSRQVAPGTPSAHESGMNNQARQRGSEAAPDDTTAFRRFNGEHENDEACNMCSDCLGGMERGCEWNAPHWFWDD